jgi:hypothetical protein
MQPYLNYAADLPRPAALSDNLWPDPAHYDFFVTPQTPQVPGWDALQQSGGWIVWRSIHLRGWAPPGSSGG